MINLKENQRFQEINIYDDNGFCKNQNDLNYGLNTQNETSMSLALTAAVTTSASNTILACNSNQNNENKEWQYLHETACLNDFYHQINNSSNLNVNKMENSLILSTIPVTATTQIDIEMNDYNLETILNIQNELILQQKELKAIEIETIKQVKQLNHNVTKLTRKFDEFVKTINVYVFNKFFFSKLIFFYCLEFKKSSSGY